jgi:hypothetical protein
MAFPASRFDKIISLNRARLRLADLVIDALRNKWMPDGPIGSIRFAALHLSLPGRRLFKVAAISHGKKNSP